MAEERPAVLIVDDRPNWRALFSDLLEDRYDVTSVGSYEEALKALERESPFCVAVVDIRLNDEDRASEDGLRLLERLKEQGTNSIIVTGYPTIETVKKALRLGAFEYLEKYPEDGMSFDTGRFRKIIHEAVDDAMLKQWREAYVVARFEGVTPDKPLEVGQHYTLSLSLEDSPGENSSLMIEIYRSRESIMEVTIDVSSMKVQPGEYRRWTIPADGHAEPLRTTLIPQKPGTQRVIIYLKVNGRPVPSLEKKSEVIAAITRDNPEV